jgi:hypothetical protein
MRVLHRCTVLLVTVVMAHTVFAQDTRPTIPEMVARGWGMGAARGCGIAPSPPLSEVLRQTDLLVAGTVGAARGYLSDDQKDIYTDHALTDTRIYYQRPLSGPLSRVALPGVLPEPSVVITELGGTATVSGRPFTEDVSYSGVTKITAGMTGLFLLKRQGNRYWLANPVLGAFEIVNDRLSLLAERPDFARELRTLPADAAVQHMLEILRQQGR